MTCKLHHSHSPPLLLEAGREQSLYTASEIERALPLSVTAAEKDALLDLLPVLYP